MMKKVLLLLFFVCSFINNVWAQATACPPNIDFESGTFTNWECFTGTAPGSGAFTLSGPVANRHTIMSGAGVDPVGGFPVVAPGGGSFSLKLGNNSSGSEAERVRYKIRIPAGFNNYSLLYNYAVVFEDPGHSASQQPRFTVAAYDSATNLTIPCLPQPYVAGAGLPGFVTVGGVKYQPWTTRTLNLSGYGGKTVYVQFTTADCTLGGHYGYAYVDLQCGLFQILNGYCPGSTTATLTAPPGFQSYSWRDSVINNIIGSGMSITIPAPADTTNFFVILTPYAGYGCVDTLQTVISPAVPPTALFGIPDTFCANSPMQVTDSSYSLTPGTFISTWNYNFGDPGSGAVNTSNSSSPTHTYTTPGTYTVSLTVGSNVSCVSDTIYKTVVIKPSIIVNAGPDTTICYNATAQLHGSINPPTPQAGTNYTYIWSPNTGLNFTNIINPVATLTTTTTFTLTTNYYPNGCSQNDQVVVNVLPPSPQINVTIAPNPTCENSPAQLAAFVVSPTCGPGTLGSCIGASVPYTVGSGTTTASFPFYSSYQDARTQILFTKGDLNAAGFNGGMINDLALFVSTKASTLGFDNFNIKIGCTNVASLAAYETGLTTVYSAATINTTAGWNNFTLTTPYVWDNVSNLVVEICYDNTSASSVDLVYGTVTGYTSVRYYRQNAASGCSLTSALTSTTRPNIRFNVCATTTAGANFQWSPASGLSNANIPNPTATLATTASYTVSVTNSTCPVAPVNVTINIVNITPSFTSVDTFCAGSPVTFTNTSTITPASVTISNQLWNFGDPASGAANTSNTLNPTHTFNLGGTYTVSLIDTSSNGCVSTTFTKTIVITPAITVNAGVNDSICAGQTYNLNPIINPSVGNYTYTWAPTTGLSSSSILNPVAQPSSTTTYILTVDYQPTGCSKSDTMVLKVLPPTPTMNVSASPATICPGSNAQLTATAAPPVCGGVLPSSCSGTNVQTTVGTYTTTSLYPYPSYWHDGRTQMLFTKAELNAAGINGGTIKELAMYVQTKGSTIPFSGFTIKLGCTNLTSLSSWQAGLTTVYTSNVSTVVSTWNNYVFTTAYDWDNINNLIVEVCYNNSSYTNYDYVRSGSTAFNSVLYYYQDNAVGCNMSNSPTATTTRPNIRFGVCGGGVVNNITYNWSPNASLSANNISNPVATPATTTTYTLTAQNGNCPVTTTNVTVTVNAINVNAGNDTTICNGTSAQLIANAVSSVAISSYSWSPAVGLSNTTIYNPVASPTVTTTYVVTVTNSTSCTQTDTVIVNVNAGFNLTTDSIRINCFGDATGSAIAFASPTDTYTYSWNTTPIQTNDTINGLIAGTYTVTVTNSLGCVQTANTIVTQPAAISNVNATTAANVTCNGFTNGMVICSAPNGGTMPYSFSWNTTPVQTNDTAFNVAAGTYTVSVTDANNCPTVTSSTTVTEPAPFSNVIASTIQNVLCFGGNNASVMCSTPTGGTTPYSFSWNTTPVQTNDTASGLTVGTYTVTVTDANNCPALTSSTTITQPAALANVNASVINHVSCFGFANGNVMCSVPTGGTTPYSFSWNTTPVQLNDTAFNIPAGNYTVTVTDNNGCSLTNSTTVTQPLALNNVTASLINNVSCFGFANGNVMCSIPTGGTAPYSFSWNTTPVQTNDTAFNVPAGNYTVTVTDSQGCILTSSVTVTQPAAISNVNATTAANVTCNGFTNGMVICSAPTGGTTPYSFSWNTTPVQTNDTAFSVPAGTYTVSVTDANNCPTVTSSTTVTQPAPLSNVIASTIQNVLCFGGNNASVMCSTPTGGTTPYSFSWNTTTVQTNDTAIGLTAGTYTVTVTDANNCPALMDSTVVTQPTALGNVNASVINHVSCFGFTNGNVMCSVPTGGTTPYSFSWNTAPVQLNDTAFNVPAGNYTVTVTDNNGCTLTNATTVTQPPAMGNVIASTNNNASCNGYSDGKVSVSTPTGGTTPYTYSWNTTPVQITDTAFNVPAGTYTVTVTDSQGCFLIDSTVVSEPSPITNVVASTINNVSCFGFSDGNVMCSSPSGGSAPYSYSWNTTPVQTNDTAFNVPVGTYTVTVTDMNNCPAPNSSTTVTQPAPLSNVIASVVNNVSCFAGANGTVTVTTPTGGTLPYSFSWNSTPVQLNDTAYNLPWGIYTVTVTDSNNCPALLDSAFVNQPTPFSNITTSTLNQVTCFGFSNGNIAVDPVSGATPPYTYSWNTSPVQSNDTAFNVPAGIYTITVTDNNGCTSTGSGTVTQPTALANVVASTNKNASCNGYSDGKVSVSTPTGGTAPYTYSWNTIPVQTTDTAFNVPAGTYTVTVADSQGCFLIDSTVVTEPAPITNVVASTINNVSCFGFSNGNVMCSLPSGGSAPYSFSWNTTPVQTNDTAFNVPAGTYTVTVTDINNCPAPNSSITVTQPAALGNVIASTINNVSCNGGSNGNITVSYPTGGTLPYSFSWNTLPVQLNDTAFNVPAGTFTITVTDSQGCTLSDSTLVTQPTPISNVNASVVNHVSCFGFSDASVTVTNPAGGTPPYTFSWNTTPVQTTQTATNLPIGTYTVTVTDFNNCSITSSTTVTQPLALANVNASVVNHVSCNGFSDGSITCSNPTGGTTPYAYSWNSTPSQNIQTATNLPIGTYTVTVTDAHGCILSSFDTIIQPLPLANVNASMITNVSCFGGNNGTATVTAPTGGTTPYTYSWNSAPTQATQTATNLIAGTYTVTVSDAHNCPPLTSSTVISQPTALANVHASVTHHVSCFGFSDGSVTVTTPTGGTLPYAYSWNTTPAQTTPSVSNLIAGSYIITVTDSHQCTLSDTTVVTQPTALGNVTASVINHISCFGLSDGNVMVSTPTGGTQPYSFSWNTSPVQTNDSIFNVPAGSYTVTVTDSHTCVLTSTAIVTQPQVLANLTASTTQNVSCYGGFDGIITTTTPTGGTTPYSYLWNTVPTQASQTVNNVAIGTYAVTMTDAHGCTISSSTTVTQPTQLSNVIAGTVQDVSCYGGNDGIAATTKPMGGTPPYSYSWNTIPVQSNDTAFNLATGTYVITVTDSKGCAVASQAIILQPSPLIPGSTSTTASMCGSPTGTATCYMPIGGTPPYNYLWNTVPPQNTPIANNLVPGTYICTITDDKNCSTTSTATVIQTGGVDPLIVSGTDITCFSGSDGMVSCANPTGGTAPYSYVWNSTPNQYSQTAIGLPPGIYNVTVTDVYGCTRTSPNVQITQPPAIAIGNIITTPAHCATGLPNGTATITNVAGGVPPYNYTWELTPPQFGATAVQIPPGLFTFAVTDTKGCSAISSFEIAGEPIAIANAGPDQLITLGDAAILNGDGSLGVNEYTHYAWSNMKTDNVGNNVSTMVAPHSNEWFVLTVYNNDSACATTDTVIIRVVECTEIFVPNAFTPNNDGIDDVYKIANPDDFDSIESFVIYDRWGRKMFYGTNKYDGWDGKWKGVDQEYGTYVYFIEIKCFGGKKVIKKGDFTLVR